jgi:protein O-mannosyl-transferase
MSVHYRRMAEAIERFLFPDESVGPLPLLLLVVTLVAYWPALGNGFVQWDEPSYVTENPLLSDPHGLWKGWTTIHETERQYYPLLLTTYWFEHRLWGDAPSGYHAVNIWLHLCNSLLVLLLLRALGAGRWAAGIGAFLFALHPIQVESVVWVAELKNLQMGFFYLAAFLLYLYYRSLAPASGRGAFVKAWAAYGATLFLYACALLSKTAAITLPLSLFLADWLLVAPRDRHWWKGSLVRVAPMLLMGIAPSLITISLEEGPAPGVIPPLVLRPFVASAALWFYIGKLAAPFSLTPIYPRWDLSAMRFWLLLSAVGLGVVGILLWHWRRRVPRVAAWGMGHFVATLLPVLGMIPFGYLDYSFVADHFVYLASIGFFVVVVVGLERAADGLAQRGVRSGRWLVTGFVCLVLAGSVGMIRAHIPIWHDPMTFWSYLAEANPRLDTIHNNLGNAYLRQNRMDEAAAHYRIALGLKPNSSLAHSNLGLVFESKRQYQQAIEEYLRAIDSQPSNWTAYYNLALVYAEMERFDEAIRTGERAIELARSRGRTQDVQKITQLIQSYREKMTGQSKPTAPSQ